MNIDGTQIETIAIGNITNIHCTSKYNFSSIMKIRSL
ncbi:MAG: hypothetical protein ACLR1Z_01400 [Eubacterium sp.]